ncbi:MAG: LysR family transcriptional regulator [Coriobacteriales bacterium]|nr:LysR family transcriptional regulator [Coriobacteriales bacterium]
MDIEYLREYLTVAGELNLTRAARLLNTTQSTLSKHLTMLEREFKGPLFLRAGKGLELTQAGTMLFRHARVMVNEYDAAKKELKHLAETVNVQVGGMLMSGDVISILSGVTALIKEQNIKDVRFSTNRAEPFLLNLEKGVLDVALRHYAENSSVKKDIFKSVSLIKSPSFLVVEKDHPLAELPSVRMEQLAQYPFVQLIGSYATGGWENIESICKKCGFEPRKYPVVVDSIVDVLTEPLGDAVMMMSATFISSNSQQYDNHRVIPIDDPRASFELCAYYRTNDEERLAKFLDLLVQASKPVQESINRPVIPTANRPFQTRCRKLAQQYGFSAEETEAMISFAKGRSLDRIAIEMNLTRVMVGDLLASVYQKLNLREKQDLLDAIEAVTIN